jgi:hypothetical protein
MKPTEEIKKELKLSQPCAFCKKTILIGDCTIWEKEAYHTSCLLKREREDACKDKIKLEDYAILNSSNTIGLFPFLKKDNYSDITEIDCSLGYFKLHECPKMERLFSFVYEEDVISVEGTRYSLELLDETRKMAKVWYSDIPKIYLQFDKEVKKFLRDKPLMLIYGDKMCFVIAPLVEN